MIVIVLCGSLNEIDVLCLYTLPSRYSAMLQRDFVQQAGSGRLSPAASSAKLWLAYGYVVANLCKWAGVVQR